jgi:TusE/DsrC/DsvC family sulfur relay protein
MKAVSQIAQLPEMDEDGLLVHPEAWNEEVAEMIAEQYDIQLGAEHWVAIYALRNYYKRFGVAPAMTSICRETGKDKHWIHNLFESCLNAWRVAGLANPGEEAKSYMSDM